MIQGAVMQNAKQFIRADASVGMTHGGEEVGIFGLEEGQIQQ